MPQRAWSHRPKPKAAPGVAQQRIALPLRRFAASRYRCQTSQACHELTAFTLSCLDPNVEDREVCNVQVQLVCLHAQLKPTRHLGRDLGGTLRETWDATREFTLWPQVRVYLKAVQGGEGCQGCRADELVFLEPLGKGIWPKPEGRKGVTKTTQQQHIGTALTLCSIFEAVGLSSSKCILSRWLSCFLKRVGRQENLFDDRSRTRSFCSCPN